MTERFDQAHTLAYIGGMRSRVGGGSSRVPHAARVGVLLIVVLVHVPLRGEGVWVVGRRRVWAGTSRRPCLVANRVTLPQKWPPPAQNVADSCELTETNKPMQPYRMRREWVYCSSSCSSACRSEGKASSYVSRTCCIRILRLIRFGMCI